MDKDTVLRVIDDYGRAVEEQGIHIAKMILYGSYARGDSHEGSDIDLIVVSDDFEGKGLKRRIRILGNAVVKVWKPVEAVAMTTGEWDREDYMAAMFAREGEVVYDSANVCTDVKSDQGSRKDAKPQRRKKKESLTS